jgi:hypothetical protein
MAAGASVSGLAARGAPAAPRVAANATEAAALASSSGQPVEVLSDRTDFSQTFAQPGGGFKDTESLVPYQVRAADGSWMPVNTSLSVQPGGVVAPTAITTGLTISDGGSGPLYTLTSGTKTLSVSWPYGPLPAPSLSGATATYPGVLPGVNLLVSATPTGVSELIEVTSAAAAANPDLAGITFPVTASGLSVSADAAGDLTAADGAGHAVFAAPAPQMWDSAAGHGMSGPGTAAPSAAQHAAATQAAAQQAAAQQAGAPVPGDHRAVLAVAARAGSVSLTPAASVLSGAQTVYPVFIDPEWNTASGSPTWSDVSYVQVFAGNGSAGTLLNTSTDSTWKNPDPQGVRSGVECDNVNTSTGACIADSSGTWAGDTVYRTFRSFLNFPLPSDPTFSGATFADAQLQMDQVWSWGCTSSPGAVSAWDTVSSSGQNVPSTQSTTWANQPAVHNWLGSDAHDYGWSGNSPPCPHQVITLPATATAQAAATNSWSKLLTLRLSGTSGNESNLYQWSWKRFAASSLKLSYYWRNAPNTPTGYGTEGTFDPTTGRTKTDCATNWLYPDWVNSLTTTWTATIDDQDRTSPGGNAANIDGEFLWQNLNNGNMGTVSDTSNPNAPGSVFTGTRAGSNRNEYAWQAYGLAVQSDPWNTGAAALRGPLAPTCYFQIDQNAPTSTVSVSSGNSQDYVGTQDTLTLSVSDADVAPGTVQGNVQDVVGFYYGIDNSQPAQYVPATVGSSSSTATITLTPFTLSEIDLYVRAVDRAGNLGPLATSGGVVVPSYTIDAQTAQGNIATMGWWRLNAHGTDWAVTSGSIGKDLAVTASGASWGCPTSAQNSPAGYVCSLSQNGSTDYASAQPVLGNDGSFSVSAWAYPSCTGQYVYCAVLSQDATSTAGGSHVSGFTLGYQRSGNAETSESGTTVSTPCPCWVFSMPKLNSAGDEYAPNNPGSGWYLAAVPAQQGETAGSWTQVTGVFNASHNALVLYVNGGDGAQHPGDGNAGDGNQAASGPAFPWTSAGGGPATGAFRVGADWNGTGLTDYFGGSVSAVCAFYGVLAPSDVENLYHAGSGDGCSVLYGTYP